MPFLGAPSRRAGVRAGTSFWLLAAVFAATLFAACSGGGDGTTREVGSAALLSFDSENVTAIAVALDDSGDGPALRVYLGVPGRDSFTLPQGDHVVAVVSPYGDMDQRLVTVTAPEGEDISLEAPTEEDSPQDRDGQRNAAAVLVDYALVFKLGMLQVEQALTKDFTVAIDSPDRQLTDEEFDTYLANMNGLSGYEEQAIAAIDRIFRDSPHATQVFSGLGGGRLASPLGGPSAGWKDSIKDFFNNNGKSGNDTRAKDTLLRNTQDLSPEAQQQVFDDIKAAVQDNPNVKNAGGVTENNAADFFKALQDGKYNKVAQDLEKGARTNPDYNTQLQQNKDTPTERGEREGGKALKDGAKVIEDVIKEVVPGPGKKVIKAGEKIDELTQKKPTPKPEQPTPKRRDQTPTTVPTMVPTTVPTTVPATVPPTMPATIPPTVPATIPPTVPPTVPPTTPPTIPPTVPPTVAATVPATVPATFPATAPAATVPPSTPGATQPAGTAAVPTVATIPVSTPAPPTAAATSGAATPTPASYINEITAVKVVLVKLGKGDKDGTTSYEIDVVVSTIVRTPPAAMVNCTTPFGTGHNIGSSSLHPGQKFTIPLHREDLYPTTVVNVTCTIREGNTMSGAVTVPGKCKAPSAAGALSLVTQDPCGPTPTPRPTETPERSQTPGASETPAGTTTAVPTAAATSAPTVAPTVVVAAPTATALPTNTPPPTLPPAPTATSVPVATPTFEPTVIDSFFWPATIFAVETSVTLEPGRLYQICLSGTMYLVEGDFGPADMALVNGIVPTPCVTLAGDGNAAYIQCGHGTPREDIDPGGFSVVVTDLGPL